ncbi:MAG: acetyltransferase, partial [Symbiobacteriaceae bacterium]|nr:acetyltransferase [Symbiobacteriaceae bacterium]
MQFILSPMTERDATRIAQWHYEGIYSFYDMDQDPDDLAELLDPGNWVHLYRSVLDEQEELVGFFCFQPDGDVVEIGLGLRPDLTGRGLGRAFVEAGLAYAYAEYKPA